MLWVAQHSRSVVKVTGRFSRAGRAAKEPTARLLGWLVGITVLLALAAWYLWGELRDDTFAKQYEAVDVNVSAQQAFHDHGLKFPKEAGGLRYSANSDLDGYPMFADFGMPCRSALRYLEANSAEEISVVSDVEELEVMATRRGWEASPQDRWFVRESVEYSDTHFLVTHRREDRCRVYVDG